MKAEDLTFLESPSFLGKVQQQEYEKPLIIERAGLEFVEQILQQFQTNELVVTCTKCHHCR